MPGPYPYQPGFGPLAPVCKLCISWNSESDVVDAILDSGASRTVIPQKLISFLGLRQTGEGEVSGAFAKKHKQPRYQANIIFSLLNKEYTALTVYVQDADFALIGRDILNDYLLTLNGPSRQFSIQ